MQVEEPKIAYSTFCQHIDTFFGLRRRDRSLPCIRFSSYSSHSVCDVCAGIERFVKACKSKEELNYAQSLKYLHREKYGKIRIAIETTTRLAYSYPKEFITIYIGNHSYSLKLYYAISKVIKSQANRTFSYHEPFGNVSSFFYWSERVILFCSTYVTI